MRARPRRAARSTRRSGRGLRTHTSGRWLSPCAAGCGWGLSGFGYWSHDIGGFEDSFGGEAGDSAGVGGVGGSGGLVGGGSVGGGGEATGAGGEGVGKVAGCGEETGGETAGGEDVGTKVDVFKRWVPFGLLSSHSRFHGSHSYRVPWAYGEEAVEVTRKFAQLKMRLMPYLMGVAREVTQGTASHAGDGSETSRRIGLRIHRTPSTCWVGPCACRRC